jgi:predicted ATPase
MIFPLRKNRDTKKEFEDYIKKLTNSENDTVRSRTLIIMQRNLTFQRVCGRVLDATFEELCDRVRLYYNLKINNINFYFKFINFLCFSL